MSFHTVQTLMYIFDPYFLGFTVLGGLYGLFVDLKKFDTKDKKRDRKISKVLYTTCIAVGIIFFAIPRIL